MPVSSLMIFTEASGTTAPVLSVIVPSMRDVLTCAQEALSSNTTNMPDMRDLIVLASGICGTQLVLSILPELLREICFSGWNCLFTGSSLSMRYSRGGTFCCFSGNNRDQQSSKSVLLVPSARTEASPVYDRRFLARSHQLGCLVLRLRDDAD